MFHLKKMGVWCSFSEDTALSTHLFYTPFIFDSMDKKSENICHFSILCVIIVARESVFEGCRITAEEIL